MVPRPSGPAGTELLEPSPGLCELAGSVEHFFAASVTERRKTQNGEHAPQHSKRPIIATLLRHSLRIEITILSSAARADAKGQADRRRPA